MENLSGAHWMHRTYRYAYTDGGEGGKAGNGGAGGKIYQVTFDVTPGQKLSYSCGTGGLGGVYSASGMVSGRAGGNTTIEGHSSASGSASENGFYDPTVNQIFGGAGEPKEPAGRPGLAYMTQEPFNRMLQTAIAQGLFGYFTSKYSWEEVEALLDWVKQQKG